MRWLIAGLVVVALSVSMLKCGDSDGEGAESFLVVVEADLHEALEERLDQYVEDLELEEVVVHVVAWEPTTVVELRELLNEHVDRHGIEGALLVGELPHSKFKQKGHMGDELGFPTDIYLQDRDSTWVDTNNDQHYDFHTPLELDIYTSRLIGSVDELQRYFERVHRYRREGSFVKQSAFIFIDNDWHKTDTSNDLYLDALYDDIEIIQDPMESSKENYVDKLVGDGAEFVFQKVHAGPRKMSFEDLDPDGNKVSPWLDPDDVVRRNFKASFLNLTNCSAADFSTIGQSLAGAYTVGTDYGLAIIGSTKVGHLSHPLGFHRNLGEGMRWGEAYKEWYNTEGVKSDKWHIGVLLMGDPLLRVRGSVGNPEGQ